MIINAFFQKEPYTGNISPAWKGISGNDLVDAPPSGEQPLQQEPQDGHQQGRKIIEGLAVLDLEQGKAGGNDQHPAHDGQLMDHRPLQQRAAGGQFGQQVEEALPAEEDRRGQDDTDAEGRSEDGGRHQVEGGIRVQEGIVALGGAENGADDRERADAEKQAGRDEAFGEPLPSLAGDQARHPAVEVEGRPEQAAQGEAQDEQHGEFALGHVLDEGIRTQGDGRQAHGREKGVVVFLAQAALEQRAGEASHNDAGGIDDGPDHTQQIYSFLWKNGKI